MSLTDIFSQSFRYDGVNNDPDVDINFRNGSLAITASIKESLSHLNLFEYAHALPELYSLIESGEVSEENWKAYIDSLIHQIAIHKNDTISPYWAVDYLGLIPMQAHFFLASVERSHKLNERYPNAYLIIVNNTSSMEGLGYSPENYDSLLSLTDIKGTTNFWYFFQLEGQSLLEATPTTLSKDKLEGLCTDYEIISTFKNPFYLQKRKWESLASPVNAGEGVGDLVFTYDSRALSGQIPDGTFYIKFKFKDNLPSDLKFDYGETIPWFDTMGNADQIKSSMNLRDLRLGIDYEILEKLHYVNGNWVTVP